MNLVKECLTDCEELVKTLEYRLEQLELCEDVDCLYVEWSQLNKDLLYMIERLWKTRLVMMEHDPEFILTDTFVFMSKRSDSLTRAYKRYNQ